MEFKPDEETMREWRDTPATQSYLRAVTVEIAHGERSIVDRARTGDLGASFVADVARLAGHVSGLRLALQLAGAK